MGTVGGLLCLLHTDLHSHCGSQTGNENNTLFWLEEKEWKIAGAKEGWRDGYCSRVPLSPGILNKALLFSTFTSTERQLPLLLCIPLLLSFYSQP